MLLLAAGALLYAAGAVGGSRGWGLLARLSGLLLLAGAAWMRRSLTLATLGCVVAGAELGMDAPSVAVHTRVLADIFLRLIRTLVAPLLLGSLTSGIAGHGRVRELGSLAWKTLLYFEVVTTLALLLGAGAAHLTHVGAGVHLPSLAAATGTVAAPPAEMSLASLLLHAFPENLALAVAENQVLQVAVFAVLFGVALATLPAEKSEPLLRVLRSLTDAMFQLTRLLMYFAPVAAGAAMAYTVGSMGSGLLLPLAKLLATFYGAGLVLVGGVLVPVLLLARVPLRRFFEAVGEPAAIGFATSTSEAALPLAMERMEAFGVPRRVVAFVLPTGYSFNMDGASVYLSVAALFAMQAGGMHPSLSAEVGLLFTLALASKGIAGVPRGTLTVLLSTASAFHLPAPALMMILGVDALMDMGRTALNVVGNCVAAAVLGRWGGVQPE
jgi:proton glutamate symport protein